MTLEQIAEQINGLNNKIDAIIAPMKEDVSGLKTKVDIHSGEIIELKEFKKGHQEHHKEKTESRRFNWEVIASSGIIGGVLVWITQISRGLK